MSIRTKIQLILTSIKQNWYLAMRWFIFLIIIQSAFSIYAVAKIPVDPKNVFLLGLSRGRLAVISVILSLDILGILLLISNRKFKILLRPFVENGKLQHWMQKIAIILMVIFWIVLWLPSYRFGQASLEYERIRPLFLWLGSIGCELFLMLRVFSNSKSEIALYDNTKALRKPIIIATLVSLGFASLYFFLQHNVSFNSGIIEPAPTPITPLQLFLIWVLAIFTNQAVAKYNVQSKPLFIALTVIAIFAISSIIFLSLPLPCEGDIVGTYPPNYVCYPDIYDAVYEVGSLYTYYGEGIFNQWFTDKPVYMLFLTICQWISGIQYQDYLTTQVLFLSLLPVAIFLLARKLTSYATALLASLLSVITQCTSILLYSKLGGVNVRITATEIFTAFLLIFSTWIIFKWFNKPDKSFLPFTAGIVLGLTTLTRFNTILIIPILVLVVIIIYIRNRLPWPRTLVNFGIGLIIVLSPWFLLNPILNPDLSNPYLEKIQNVFVRRSTNQTSMETIEQIPSIVQMNLIRLINFNPEQSPATQQIKLAQLEDTQNNQTHGFMGKVALHFTNNLMSGFFSLPINAEFHDSRTIISQPFWEIDNQSIWQRAISPENLLLWCLSVFLFLWGIWLGWRRWGAAGLAPLIIFIGYLLGNSFALTSGGRYLLPVIWVIFLYYSFGLLEISKSIFEKLGLFNNLKQAGRNNNHVERIDTGIQKFVDKPGFRFTAIALLLLPAIALPFLQMLPNKLPQERTSEVEQNVYAHLEDNLDLAAWNAFLAEENSIIVEGVVFFPQYFNQSKYSAAKDTNVFEALVLGKDFIYMSYTWNQIPEHVTDGSKVLIAGCKIKEGELWGMERRIVHTFAMIQLNNEKARYLDPQASWTCQ